MKLFRISILLFALSGAGLGLGCEGDTPSPGTDASDTTSPTDTRDATSPPDGTSDTATPIDTTPNTPDIETPPGSVKAVQAESAGVSCNPDGFVNVNDAVTLTGVVVTSPKFDAYTPKPEATGEALDGYYVADQDGGLYSGVYVSIPRAQATNFLPGQVVDITGESLEFYCNTQVNATTMTAQATVAAPAPLEIQASEVGEPYEGMLVKLSGVTVTGEPFGGLYTLDTEGVLVGHQFSFFLSMDVGASYDVTGQVYWANSPPAWRVMPRTQADLVKSGGGTATTIVDIQSSTGSTDCNVAASPNYGQVIAPDLSVTAVIASERIDATSKYHAYFVSDGSQAPSSGMLVIAEKTLNTNYALGDNVQLRGTHKEYKCETQFEQSIATVLTTHDLTPPTALSIAAGLTDSEMEQYEGMLVTIPNVMVTGQTAKSEAETDAGVLIDSYIIGKSGFTVPTSGTHYATITGFVHFYEKFRISPRTTADLVVAP